KLEVRDLRNCIPHLLNVVEVLQTLFLSSQYIPHGHCYLWQTPLVALHLVSDLTIALAYFSIPAMLLYFVKQRRDVPFLNVLILFSAFIILCGFGHLLEIWTLWHPTYWLTGIEQAATALVSCYTALQLWTLLPQFLSLKTPEQLDAANQQLQWEIAERQQAERILKNIVEGTASTTGEVFFSALVENLALALGVRHVFLAELVSTQPQRLKTLAFWAQEGLAENIEYDLAGTPCEPVIEQRALKYYPTDVQECFPKATGLVAMEAQCYLGVPLLDGQGQVLGILCMNHDRALEREDLALEIVRVFAARAAVELQRQRAESALQRAYEELEVRVKERTAELAAANAELQRREAVLREQQNGLLALATDRNLYAGNLGAALERITEVACNTLEVERCGVWLHNKDKSALYCVDWYDTATCTHGQGKKVSISDDRGYRQVLTTGSAIATCDMNGASQAAEVNATCVEPFSMAAVLSVPIYLQGDRVGLLSVEQGETQRTWEIEEQNFVSHLGYMTALAMEASERKQAEAALKKSERQLRLIIDALPVCISYVDAQHCYQLANKAYETWFGRPQTDFRGKPMCDIIGEEAYQVVRPQVVRALQGETVRYEAEVPYRDGGTRYIEAALVPDIDEEAGVRGFYAMIADISDRKKAEESLKQEVDERRKTEFALRLAQNQSDRLLRNILPEKIARQLKHGKRTLAEHFNEVTVLFADLVGFTPLAAQLEPIALVDRLNQIFSTFDKLAEQYGLEKIKTIGDAYMVVGGVPTAKKNHAEAIADMALEMQRAIAQFSQTTRQPLQIRIGINTGPVVAGVIGIQKFSYDLWGNTVNIASRMEASAEPGTIQVTPETYERLKDKYWFDKRGTIEVKGKGAMTTYWLREKQERRSR
ncbi:MAG: adenylate/guanylate cyclase domain-containing protein, partial [Cyanobacteriota bacterium]|nr:adenylate/guanylate cyclase domain-containing protein [Cyanobacteriota bacterium]